MPSNHRGDPVGDNHINRVHDWQISGISDIDGEMHEVKRDGTYTSMVTSSPDNKDHLASVTSNQGFPVVGAGPYSTVNRARMATQAMINRRESVIARDMQTGRPLSQVDNPSRLFRSKRFDR